MIAHTTGEILVDLAHRDDFTEKINALPTTRSVLTSDDVAVLTPRLIGTETTSGGGQLRKSDLELFASLAIGAPILVGHQKDTKPVGRVYDAWVENQMVYSPFYIPTARSDANDLLIDIRTGVIAEVSASFSFDKPMCAVCNRDMRSLACGHIPGKDGVFFYYDTPKKVLEVSLVYRGGYPGTGFINLADDPEWAPKFKSIQKRTDEMQSTTENLMVTGLVSLLVRLIEDKVKNDYGRMTRIQCLTQMASFADMAVSEVEALLTSEVKVCPTFEQLRGFAQSLGCGAGPLIREAIKDGCAYDLKQIQKRDGEVVYRSYF